MSSLDYVREVCRIGAGADCCRYLVGDGSGLHCARLADELAAMIDARVRAGLFHARAVNCEGKPIDEILR